MVTYDEWLEMPEVQDQIEEVVKGEIILSPPAKVTHATVVDSLGDILRAQINIDQVLVRTAQFGLIIRKDPLGTRVPDLAMFRRRSIVEQDGYIHSAPEFIAEVLSPSNDRADHDGKIRDYAELGVAEVWVLSPEAHTIEVLLLECRKLRTVATLREGQLRPKLFPEVVVDAASVWPD